MSVNQYNLQNLSWQRAYSSLTGQEFLDLLISQGYLAPSTETNPAQDIDYLRPDGVISNLHYNGGQGYLVSESPAVYVGRLFKDPGQASYATSSTYHKAPWLIKPALESAFYANRYGFLSGAGLSDGRIDEVSDPEPKSSSGGVSRSILYPWGSAEPSAPIDKIGATVKAVPWINGSNPAVPDGATLRTPASLETLLAGTESPNRVVRAYSEYVKYYTDGDWRYLNRDGLITSWSSPPGLWLDQWEDLVLEKWDAWCAAWDAHVDDGNDPIDVLIWNGEYRQSFYDIQANLHTSAAPLGNPGGFDGAGNGIVEDSRWDTAWPEMGIEDVNGNSLWHMGDPTHARHWTKWNVFDDVRSSLFTAWERGYRYSMYTQLVDIARNYASFENTKFLMYDMAELAGITYECGAPATYALVAPGRGLELPSASWYGGTRSKEFRWGTASSPSITQDAWNAFTNGIATFRSTQACSNKEKAFWISAKSYNTGSNTDLYEEAWFHALLSKPNDFTFLYTEGIQESEWSDLKDILDHFDTMAGASERFEVLQPKVSYFDKYVISTLDVGGKFLSRVTPRPDTVVDVVDNLDGVTFTISDGSSITFSLPTGSIVPSPSYPHGYWVEQSSLIAPGVVAGPGTTYYYVGDGTSDVMSNDQLWSLSPGGANGAGPPGVSDTVVIPGDVGAPVSLYWNVDVAELQIESGAEVSISPAAQATKISTLVNHGIVTVRGNFTYVDVDTGAYLFEDAWFEFQDIQNYGTLLVDQNFVIRGGISVNEGTVDWSGWVSPPELTDNQSAIYIGSPGGTIAPGDYRGIHEIGILATPPDAGGPEYYLVTDYLLADNVVLNLVPGEDYKFDNLLIGGSHHFNCNSVARNVTLECNGILCYTYEGLTTLDISGSSITIGTELDENIRFKYLAIGSDENISLIYDSSTEIDIIEVGTWEPEDEFLYYCITCSSTPLPPITLGPGARMALGVYFFGSCHLTDLYQEPGSRVLAGGFDGFASPDTSIWVENWVCRDAVIEYGGYRNVEVAGNFDFSGYIVPITHVDNVNTELNPTLLNLMIAGDLTVRGTVLDRDHETILDEPVRSYWSGRGGRARESLYFAPQGLVDVENLESYYVVSSHPIESESSIGCWNRGFRISSNCPQREDAAMAESQSGSGSNQDPIPELRDPGRVQIDRLWRRF